jgi:hypothetical protein
MGVLKKKVYIAGPLSLGDPVLNIRKAIEVADRLLVMGHLPQIPHLTYFWHLISPKDYEAWLKMDFDWIETCDYLLRIPGESLGADREVEHANSKRIPVYFGLDHFIAQIIGGQDG